jgi:hypothetical protein
LQDAPESLGDPAASVWRSLDEDTLGGEFDGAELAQPEVVGGVVYDERELGLNPCPYVLELVAHGSAYRLLSWKKVATSIQRGLAGSPVGRL